MKLLSRDREIQSFFGTIPLMAASIRLTKRCNLQCEHCYANSVQALNDPDELSTKELFGIIDQLAEMSVNEIFFTGGEPLMRSDIVDILHYTFSKGIRILISTNGILLGERFLSKVQDVDFKLFQISLDGPEQVHDSIRGPGKFKRTIKALKLASSCLKRNVAVGTVLSSRNADCIGQTMELAYEAGANVFALMILIVSGRATQVLDPSALQLTSALDDIFKVYRQLSPQMRFAHNTTIPPALYPPDLIETGLHTQCALCSFPYTVGIEANGDVAPCDGFFGPYNFVAGNLRQHSLKDLWENSPLFDRVRTAGPDFLSGVCSLCRYRDFCGGGCRASAFITGGHINASDPSCEKLYTAGLFPASALSNQAETSVQLPLGNYPEQYLEGRH